MITQFLTFDNILLVSFIIYNTFMAFLLTGHNIKSKIIINVIPFILLLLAFAKLCFNIFITIGAN